MPFQPGQSGNPEGARSTKPFRDALRMEMLAAERGEECFAPKGSLRWNARQLLERGQVDAIKELADRLDGKVPQAVTSSEAFASPINILMQIFEANPNVGRAVAQEYGLPAPGETIEHVADE